MHKIQQRYVSVYDRFEMLQLISEAYQWFNGEPTMPGQLDKIYRDVKRGCTPLYIKGWCDMYRITLTWVKGKNRLFDK